MAWTSDLPYLIPVVAMADAYLYCLPSFICPISNAVMRDPVVCADGHSFEREPIAEWLLTHDTNPTTNAPLPKKTLIPNRMLRGAIDEWSSSFAKAFKEIPRDAITIERQIGRGRCFRAVYEGTYKEFRVAVLKLRAGSCDTETATLVRLGQRQGLVRYLGMCCSEGEQLLLAEYAPHGSLYKLLEAEQVLGPGLSLRHKLAMMRQVCAGMQALAEEGMVHRNLAARNVLVFRYDRLDSSYTRAKVSDFGLAVSIGVVAPSL